MKEKHLSTAMTAFMLTLASLTLPPVGDLHAAEIFTRVTSGPGSDAGRSRGGAWGDYDNDGFIDLFVPQIGENNDSANPLLYHNNTNGTFSRVTTGPVAQAFSAGGGGAWGDYDNDGNLDLFLLNQNQPDYLFHNNGDGSFAAVPSSVSFNVATSGGVTWVDFDNDGYVDIFRTAWEQPRRLYRNNHDGTFTGITGPGFLTVPGNFLGAAWGDYNNDGRPDLFLPSADQPINYLYRNDGGGSFTRVGAGTTLNGNSNPTGGGAWGDYDNDGDLDLFASCAVLVGGNESRPNLFYRNDGNDTFTSLPSLPANDPEYQGGASAACTWGDYDNDGWLDLFVANRDAQNDYLYHNNGNGTFTKVLDSVAVKDGANGLPAAWGDYDNDGFLDLFVGNYSGTHLLYHNNGNDNHWLKFRMIGTRSNRAAIGAKVRVRATINGQKFWQMREISGGDGVRGQNSLHVHVGLGNATNADLVRIEWPSGTVQEFRDVAANQMLAIQESVTNIFVVDIFPDKADVMKSATLTLSVTNAPLGSIFQWQLNGVDLTKATNATLELSNVTTNQSGDYRAVVTTANGVLTTDPATVRVFDQATITTQPRSFDAVAGQTHGFSVTAMGALPLTYQWQRNGTNLAGKTTRFLTLSASVATEGNYTVVVSDANGSVVSQPATLRVLITPAFTQPPLSQSVVAGGSVTFSAAITGNPAPFLYQWRQGAIILTNMVLSEQKAFFALSNVQPSQAGTYRVVITNAASPTISVNASWNLTVLPDTDGDGLPDEMEIAYGLNLNDPSDALADADGDRMNNLAEYQSGTSPTNAASLLKLETVTQANGKATLTFQAAANQTYSVEWNSKVAGGAWQKLVDVVAQSADRQATVTDAGAADSARFYRVVTPRRP